MFDPARTTDPVTTHTFMGGPTPRHLVLTDKDFDGDGYYIGYHIPTAGVPGVAYNPLYCNLEIRVPRAVFRGALRVAGDITADGDIVAAHRIDAGGSIDAGGDIVAVLFVTDSQYGWPWVDPNNPRDGERIVAEGYIKAGGDIVAGTHIMAGSVHLAAINRLAGWASASAHGHIRPGGGTWGQCDGCLIQHGWVERTINGVVSAGDIVAAHRGGRKPSCCSGMLPTTRCYTMTR